MITRQWIEDAPQVRGKITRLRHDWLRFLDEHCDELATVQARDPKDQFLCVFDAIAPAGAYFEEIFEDIGVPVRRLPSTPEIQELLRVPGGPFVVIVDARRYDNTEFMSVLTCREMARHPDEVEAGLRPLLSGLGSPLSSSFLSSFVAVVYHLAQVVEEVSSPTREKAAVLRGRGASTR